MSKVLKTVVAVVGAVAAVLSVIPGPWQPIATIVAVAASVTLTALTLLDPYKPKSSLLGQQTSFKIDPNAGIPYAIGRTFYAGNAVHRDTWGDDNEYQGNVIVWSGAGPIDAIEHFEADRASIGFAGGAATGSFNGFMWLNKQLGATPSPALASPVAGFPNWGANSKLSGFAAGCWVTKFDKKGKKFASGLPDPGVVMRGVKVYDPRLDDTYPGGSGPCRALDESTYVYSANPWLHALTFALGRWQNNLKVMGIGMAISGINVPSYVDAANIAEFNGWEAGGVISSVDDKWEVMKMLGQAGGGQPVRLGGQLSAHVEGPRVAIATITTEDVVGRCSVAGTQFERRRLNSVVPVFRSEAHGWEQIPGDVVSYPAYVTDDGGTRTGETEFVLVQDKDHAAQLAAYEILNGREFGPIDLELKIRWIGIQPGDLVNIDIPEAGLANQPCLCLSRGVDPSTGNVLLSFRSETPGKHATALGQTTNVPATPSLVPVDLSVVPAPNPLDWTISTVTPGVDGSLPLFVAKGTTGNPNASHVVFEYRPTAGPVGSMPGSPAEGDIATDTQGNDFVFEGGAWVRTWLMQATQDAGVQYQEFSALMPGVEYELSISYVAFGVLGQRLLFPPVVAGDLIATNSGSLGGIPSATIVGAIDAAQADATAAAAAAAAALSHLNDIANDDLLTPSEKAIPIQQYTAIISEQGALGTAATGLNIVTELAAYNSAITSLTTYLGGLTSPVSWSNKLGNTIIDGDTFAAKFSDVYVAKQALLNAMAFVKEFPPGIALGALGDVVLTPNQNAAGSANNGEIRTQGTMLHLSSGVSVTLPTSPGELGTTYEGGLGTRKFYVIAGQTATSTRFPGGSFGSTSFLFTAEYNSQTGIWTVYDDATAPFSYTPAATDAIIAVGSRNAGDPGITNFTSVINYFGGEAVGYAQVITGALNTGVTASQVGTLNLAITLNAPNNNDAAAVTSPNLEVKSENDAIFVNGSVTTLNYSNRAAIYLQRSVNGGATWSNLFEISSTGSQAVAASTYNFSYEDTSHSPGQIAFRVWCDQSAAQTLGDGTAGNTWDITGGNIRVRRFFAK